MNDLFFRYVPGDSFLHRLDPRVKITGMMIVSISIFMSSSLREMSSLSLIFFLLFLVSSISPKIIFGTVRPMLLFLVVILILQFFLMDGEPVFYIMGHEATYEGLRHGILLTLRFLFLLMFASLLTATTAPSLITAGMERMLRPLPLRKLGVSSFDLATMVFLSLHFVPFLYGSFSHLRDAQISRGLDMRRNPFGAVYSLSVPMVRISITSAEEVAVAMESRCYQGEHRSSLHILLLQKKDIAALISFSILVLALV